MLTIYFKIGWRKLIRNKVSSIINILGLAIGISFCLIIYSIVSFELSYDTFHPDKERIYRIVRDYQEGISGVILHFGTVNSPIPMAVRDNLTSFETVAGFHNFYTRVIVPDGREARKFDMPVDGKEVSDVIVTEPQYFDIFKYQWLYGNAATSLDAPFKVVLTESEAHKYFGSLALNKVMGKELIYNETLRVTISGIVKDQDENTDFAFKDFISLSTARLKNRIIDLTNSGRSSRFSQAFVKLAKGVTPQKAEANLRKLVHDHPVEVGQRDGDKVILRLQALSDIHFNENYADAYSRKVHLPTLYSLMGLAAFILLIAVINYVNLATAYSIERGKEVGIRKVLGGRRLNIAGQFLIETLLITCFAALLSTVIVTPVLIFFHSFLPEGLIFRWFTPSTLVFLALIVLATTLLASFYPAKVLSAHLPAISLKGRSAKGNPKSHLRRALIVFQFSVSLVFIIGAIVINRQTQFIRNKDLGFSKDAIINIPTSGQYQFPNYPGDKRGTLARLIRQLPNVGPVSVSRSELADIDHNGINIITRKGKNESILSTQVLQGDENLIPLFGLKLLAGRNLLASDTIQEFVINETCAKALGYNNPADAIGKFLEWGPETGSTATPVVGVVSDFNSQPLYDPIAPTLITANTQLVAGSINLKLHINGKNANQFNRIMTQIEKLWKEVFPNERFRYSFFDEDIARFYEKEEKTEQVTNTAMVVAIFISCMGLFGLVAYSADQRNKEIGIRKVLGASVTNIVSMLSRDFLKLVFFSIVIASPTAYYLMHQWLAGFAYRIHISWWIFVLAGMFAILIALITMSFKAIGAALANPVNSLRSE